MAWAILDEGDQVGIVGDTGGAFGRELFKQRTDATDYVDVLLLVVPADVVGLADLAFGHNFEQGTGVILDVQPVANLQAVAIDRQRFARQGVENHQWNQLLREVERPVVV
ncbi:hypothetical protein D3C72_1745700 [compost metagenome]